MNSMNSTAEVDFARCALLTKNFTDYATSTTWLAAKFWTEIGLLSMLNILVVVGNCFVLTALIVDKQLRNPTHYFICSLALADLTLGLFVLPFATMFQVHGVWLFGATMCQMWLAVDVWLCTASIYSLIAVTFDRYIAVTKPLTYKSIMTHKRAMLMILAVWTVSLIICLPAFALSLHQTYTLATATCQCTQMAHSAIYIAYSSTGSFYLPMVVIVYLYARIYVTVRKIRLSGSSGIVSMGKSSPAANKSPTREHVSLLDKGRQLSAVLRVHKGRYHPARCSSRKGLVGRLSAHKFNGLGLSSRRRQDRANGVVSTGDLTADHGPRKPMDEPPKINGAVIDQGEHANLLAPPKSPTGTARHMLSVSCPNSAQSSPRASITAETKLLEREINDSQPSANPLAHDLWLHLTMPSQLTSMWCQRIVAFQKYQKKFSLELKALKTVGIVTGCFFVCWLGFCIVYTMQALPYCRSDVALSAPDTTTTMSYFELTTTWYRDSFTITESSTQTLEALVSLPTKLLSSYSSIGSCVPDWVINLMVWLGYVNSAINPIIYGISNQQFRRTFRRILRCEFFKCCNNSSAV